MPSLNPINLPDHLKRQLRQTVIVDDAAQSLYDHALLLDDSLQVTWDHLPQSMKSRYRAEVAGSLYRLGIITKESM